MPQTVRVAGGSADDDVIPATQMISGNVYIVVRGDDVFPAGRVMVKTLTEVACIGGPYPMHAGWARMTTLEPRGITVRRPRPGERIIITTEA